MDIQFASADLSDRNIVPWDNMGNQPTRLSEQLWPDRRVTVTTSQTRRVGWRSLSTACYVQFVTTMKDTSAIDRWHSLIEKCRQTDTTAGNLVLLFMEEAAQANDHREFATWADRLGQVTSAPDEFVRAIELALSLELATLARDLAQKGALLYPDYEKLEQAARVLAPPSVRPKPDMPPARGLKASMTWLSEHASPYRGLWVAVRCGRLIAEAPTLRELEASIGQDGDVEGTIVTKVL